MENKNYKIDQELTDSLIETITHPAFTKFISDIENQPESSRAKYAEEVSNITELERRGIPLKKEFRICLRTFEDPLNPISLYDYSPENQKTPNPEIKGTTICASIGYVACASVGYEK